MRNTDSPDTFPALLYTLPFLNFGSSAYILGTIAT